MLPSASVCARPVGYFLFILESLSFLSGRFGPRATNSTAKINNMKQIVSIMIVKRLAQAALWILKFNRSKLQTASGEGQFSMCGAGRSVARKGVRMKVIRALTNKMAAASLLAGSVLFWSHGASASEAGVGVEPPELSEASIARGKKIFNEGKGDAVTACQTCHGVTGWGLDAMGAPRLANIGYPYIVKQLSDLASGKRVPSGAGAVMVVYAAGLNEQDRRDLAAYASTLDGPADLSDLNALKEAGTSIGERYLGESIVKYGVLGKVSACSSCHGFNGRGAAPLFPRIGQQKYVYLINQLKSWRDGSRANDPYAMMQKMAKNLTDADIDNAATFLAMAPVTTVGNGRAPITTQ
jgi:cytochrome c553